MQPTVVLEHEAVTTLHNAAFRVLVLLSKQFTGHNNGAIGLSKAQASEHGISNKTLYKALHDLEARGLIEMTYPASRVPPRPTMYALSWLPKDNTNYSNGTSKPSNKYRDGRPSLKPNLVVIEGKEHATG